MIIGLRDTFKLISISIVCFCGVFVCTFFLNYYLDIQPLRDTLSDPYMLVLYEAQEATAQFTSVITGVVLALIAAVMLVFYIKLYIDGHAKQLGIIKAMGYSDVRIASRFWVFGLSVFSGCALGFCAGFIAMPMIYAGLTIEGIPEIPINFHAELLFGLVFAPSLIFTALSCLYAFFAVGCPVMQLMRGKPSKIKDKSQKEGKERPFLNEMCFKTLGAKKSLAFFVAFACFCFGAMTQMGLSMENLTSASMGYMILIIGLVLAVVAMFMAVTALVNGNIKNISVMKAFGYSMKACALTVLGGYVPFGLLGFGLGTAYQYGLLQLMVNIIFADVGDVPEYTFNVPVFFITFALFIVAYASVMAFYALRINKISVKEVMAEN